MHGDQTPFQMPAKSGSSALSPCGTAARDYFFAKANELRGAAPNSSNTWLFRQTERHKVACASSQKN